MVRPLSEFAARTTTPRSSQVQALEAAKNFANAGVKWLHVIDVDGSLEHQHTNHQLIREIIDAIDIPAQVGAEYATLNDVDWWLEYGACARYPWLNRGPRPFVDHGRLFVLSIPAKSLFPSLAKKAMR